MTYSSSQDIFKIIAKDDWAAVRDLVDQQHVSLLSTYFSNQTIAHFAARHCSQRVLEFVIKREPSLLTVRDTHCYTVFHRAVEKSTLCIVKYLVEEWKADIYQPVNYVWGNTALHIAAQAGKLDIVKYFIEDKNVDPSLKNRIGQPPAFSAASSKHLHIIKYLVECQKVDVTMTDSKNDNILFLSARMKDLKVPKYLLDDRKLKFDVNWRGNLGRTIVYWAARNPKISFMEYFVEEKNANVNIADDQGLTPLHHAAKVDNLEIVKYLVQHKAKIMAKDVNGSTPVDMATDQDTIRYLRKNMSNRSRRSIIPQRMFFPIPLPNTNQIGKTGLRREPGGQFKSCSSLLCCFLVATDIMFKGTEFRYTAVTHTSLLSSQENIRNRMDAFVIDTIDRKLYK